MVVLCARSRHASRQRRLVVEAEGPCDYARRPSHFAALGRAVVCQRRVGRGRLKAQYDPENLFRMNYSVPVP